ncbi:maltooligosyltrehalose trehalohydrolase [Rhizomicrobium palustre]|uniref:Malto-oligosyltrehalose trehalohydrolase n=1 Tax=Rhizomicrobium palustre TaxID=189966 RepID=A0A846N285_9PROT|nr:malto-oligosyltrehalose trehalohydrolase [Rhizomicrobium palustre]NIK89210.1 maltooligosyltrehalose trehalohydrolase [Rhizomicrobium palustre]
MTSWGPEAIEGGTRFRLWAPDADTVELEFADAEPVGMDRGKNGWWAAETQANAGTRYRFRIGGVSVPDPASHRQSGDVHGWSVVQPNSYAWKNDAWKPRPWEETILYELHAGLTGGYSGVGRELVRLANMGITAIELMPINDFPGARNWGYDGVLPYAPDESYGTPDALKALIDAAHGHGMMVFLDVVYNHFGPDGNYLPLYAKSFFRSDRKTPWGDAIDFRQEPVRRFFIDNALYWLGEFRFDGLRFDAVHAIHDGEFLRAMAQEIKRDFPDRHLVLENEDNDASLLKVFRAQWNDDFHNTLHAMLTGEDAGYYADFAQDSSAKLARLLHQGFAYQGETTHTGHARGTPSGQLRPTAFVSFLQNHDQTGNRALGERLIKLCDPRALKAAAALQLLAPQIPMLFMGEEMGAREPFLFFTDHQDPELAKAVREGRAAEFAKFPAFASGKERVPDPNALETFEQCRLGEPDPEWLNFYRALLALRHEHIIPRLKGSCCLDAVPLSDKAVISSWKLGDGYKLTIAANLSENEVEAVLPQTKPIYGEAENTIPPFSTVAWIEMP